MGDLIERLEAATVGSRELDRTIWFAVEFRSDGEPSHAPRYTTSLDAALALAERLGLNVVTVILAAVELAERDPGVETPGSLARYVCIAILRALSPRKGGDNG